MGIAGAIRSEDSGGSRLADQFVVIAVVFALALAFGAAQASATALHENLPAYAFAPDGTEDFSNTNSFYEGGIVRMAVDSKRHRLYVLQSKDPYDNGNFWPGVKHALYGYDISDPGDPKPLTGTFPLSVTERKDQEHWLAVDEADGSIYLLEKNGTCFSCEDGGMLYSWNAEGKIRPGYPTSIGKQGPFAVDPKGYLWVWRTPFNSAAGNDALKKFLPDGTLVEEFDPGVPAEYGSPVSVSFNADTEDMWLQYTSDLVKFTSDSGYEYHDAPIVNPFGSGRTPLVVDSAHDVLYGADQGKVLSLNDQSGLVEEAFGVGGGGVSGSTGVRQSRYTAMGFDASGGDVYVVNDGYSNGQIIETEQEKAGRLEVFTGSGAVDARTAPPIDVGKTTAAVAGTVGPGEAAGVTDCEFQYVTEESFGDRRVVSLNGATGGRFKLESPSAGWLAYNATAGQLENAISTHPEVTGPPGGPWTITAVAAADMGKIESRLAVAANELEPSGTKVRVDWDASTVPCEPAPSGGSPFTSSEDVEAEITGLSEKTQYHYRVVAGGSTGTVWGGTEKFSTAPSRVRTGDVTGVSNDSATLNGTVDPEGLSTTYYFEYGRTPAYGSTTAAPPGEDLGTTVAGDQPVAELVSGLEPGKTYHYRIVAVNGNGTSQGVDRTFETDPAISGLETLEADEITRTGARLRGKLDPANVETHYYFEWGTTRRYGHTTAVPPGTALGDTSAGDKTLTFALTGLEPGQTYHYRLVASNSTGSTPGDDRVFATLPAVSGVSTLPATDVKTTEATLQGTLDPEGIPTTFYFEYGKSTAYGFSAPAPPGEDVGTIAPGTLQVSFVLTELTPGTTYHYRLVAVNSIGTTVATEDQSFTTPAPPIVEGVTSDHVTADSAELKARINPNGHDTTYRFEYGTSVAYGSVAPVPDGELGPLVTVQPVSVQIGGLQAATYHFRLVAESEWGTVASEDQTFEFAPPVCPNATLRQQTGSNYLPDCRAYELVTPGRAGGAILYAQAPWSPVAGDRLGFSGFFNAVPGTDPINSGVILHGDLYVASRSNSGWVTRSVGLKGNQASQQDGNLNEHEPYEGNWAIPTDERMERFLTWNTSGSIGQEAESQSNAPYMWDAEGNELGRLPTNADEVPGATTLNPESGGFIGDHIPSPDFTHYAFSAIRLAFTPDGVTTAPGSAYDNNLETETVEKISVDEDGNDLEQDPAVSGGFEAEREFIKLPAISRDGSHILMSTKAAGAGLVHLYLHVQGKGTFDISTDYSGVEHGVHFDGMVPNGSEVFFTTAVQMTPDDEDESADLYRWDESTSSLTRVSAGVVGTGNSDGCGGAWIKGCGVEVVPIYSEGCVVNDFGQGLPCRDTPIAANTGEIYFYSPEQLDQGARGVPGNRNLYVWRDGAPRFVASLEPTKPAVRINVARNGRWMALVTRSTLTPFDNANHLEMYRYDAEGRQIICVSCRRDGEPPTSDVEGSVNGLFLADDGRTFFATREALVDRDADGVKDTYEYVNGRPYLISGGAELQEGSSIFATGLIGVTADGVNAFFSTRQTFVGQDENGPAWKIYDARINGGIPYDRPQAPCAAADECHGEGSSPPPIQRIGSSADLGDRGNISPAKRKAKKKKHRRRGKRGRRGHGRQHAENRRMRGNGHHTMKSRRHGRRGAGR